MGTRKDYKRLKITLNTFKNIIASDPQSAAASAECQRPARGAPRPISDAGSGASADRAPGRTELPCSAPWHESVGGRRPRSPTPGDLTCALSSDRGSGSSWFCVTPRLARLAAGGRSPQVRLGSIPAGGQGQVHRGRLVHPEARGEAGAVSCPLPGGAHLLPAVPCPPPASGHCH